MRPKKEIDLKQGADALSEALEGLVPMQSRKKKGPKGPRKINGRMEEAAKRSAEGESYSSIAKELGMSKTSVGKWFRRDDMIQLRKEHMKRLLEANVCKAYKVLSDQLDNENPWVAQGAARELIRLYQQNEDTDKLNVNVNFGCMPTPGAPSSAEDIADAHETLEATFVED